MASASGSEPARSLVAAPVAPCTTVAAYSAELVRPRAGSLAPRLSICRPRADWEWKLSQSPPGERIGEREHDEHGDGCEHAERAQRAAATCDLPDVDRRERDDDQRVELRRHREPEQAEAEQLAAAQDCGERSDRERRREEVVGVQRDRPDGDRREREQHRRGVEAAPRGAERDEREQDGEERRDPAQRHQRLESRRCTRRPGRTAGGMNTANAPGGYSTKTSRYGSSPRRKPSA